MPKVKFQLNRDGVADLLRGPDVARTVALETGRVANAAGRGFEGETTHGNRTRGYVRARTIAAMRTQMREHTLERAIGLTMGGGRK